MTTADDLTAHPAHAEGGTARHDAAFNVRLIQEGPAKHENRNTDPRQSPQPRHRPQLPPAHWLVIDAWLAAHMPRPLP